MLEHFVKLTGKSAVDVAPPVVMTAYAAVQQGLPLILWLLSLILVALRVAKFVWDWQMAIEDRKAARKAPGRTEADE